MNKCPYCGKEYPDSAAVCELDANPLISGKAAPAPLGHNAEMTGLDKYFAKSSSIFFWGLDARLLWGFIGVLACKHPTARKNAWIYFGWQAGGLVLAFIIIVLVKNAQAK
ncbi:MAG: hypothetical protein WBG19_03685 [Thermoplasmata archaeon]